MPALVLGTIVLPNEEVTNRAKKAYTYVRSGYGGDVIVTYSYTQDKNYTYFNRNLHKFKRYFDAKLEYTLIEGEDIVGEMREGFALYPRQQEVEDKVLAHISKDINCLIQAPVRFGKTILLASLLTKFRKKTLILVDRTLLAEQMLADIQEYSTLDVGYLKKDGELNDVTVATFQYIHANPGLLERIKGSFGVVAADEAHVCAATTYTNIINTFPVRIRIGLTATPTRSSDKLTEVLTDLFGEDIIVGVNKDALKAQIEFVTLPKQYFPSPYSPKASLGNYLTSPEVALMVNAILKRYEGKTIMIVSDLKKVQTFYCDYALNSDMKKSDRTETMQRINSGEIKVFSGYGVMLKGITIPKLEVIIHLMAATTKENLMQLQGRLLTPPNKGETKTPIFVEMQTLNQSWKEGQRQRWLEELPKSLDK